MNYKKSLISISLLSLVFMTACEKSKQSNIQPEADVPHQTQPTVHQSKKSEHEQMLAAVQADQKQLLEGNCSVNSFENQDDKLIIGDLNHDGKNDFLYDYATVLACDAQVPLYKYAVYIQNKKGEFDLVNVFHAGMQNDLDRVELNKIQDNIVQGIIVRSDEKVKYIFKEQTLVEQVDPNKKINIVVGKQMLSDDSPFAADLDRMAYVPEEVECGGFFSDDQAEKSTTIGHYGLRISGENVVVIGVYGLTAQDVVNVAGKTLTSASTTTQVKQLFKGYEISETKSLNESIGSAGEDAAKLKYDVMYSINDKTMDDAYLFYFKNNQLIAVQYFIPC